MIISLIIYAYNFSKTNYMVLDLKIKKYLVLKCLVLFKCAVYQCVNIDFILKWYDFYCNIAHEFQSVKNQEN